MGQQRAVRGAGAAGRFFRGTFLVLAIVVGCDRGRVAAPAGGAGGAPTIASLVPAATDLIVGMGARDRLVAVSTFDASRPDVAGLSRVGDYQTTDWETLATLQPACMVIQIDPAHVPPGMLRRAAAQNMQLLDVRIDRLDDIPVALRRLGEALQMSPGSATAAAKLQEQLDAVRQSVKGMPPVPALVVVGEQADSLAGPATFLDDLLSIAGGRNAAAVLGRPWPEVDGEALLSLRPRVVMVLVPEITPQGRSAVMDRWRRLLADRPDERVFLIDDWYALLPGMHVGELAAQMAGCLDGVPTPPGVRQPVRVQ